MPCRAIVLPVDLPQILERISRHHAHPFWVAYRKGVPTARGQYVVLPRETLPMIGFTRPQLQHAFRHAGDFGVVGNASNTTLAEFSAAIHQHVIAEGTRVIAGTYRNVPVTHFVDPHTGLNVIRDASGNFLAGWQLNPKQLVHVLHNGKLGGG